MTKRGGKVYKVNLNRKLQKMSPAKFKLLEKKEEYKSKMIKRIFYVFLDIIILLSFLLSLYFTYIQNYVKTILFLATGSLLLIFFVLGRIFKDKKK